MYSAPRRRPGLDRALKHREVVFRAALTGEVDEPACEREDGKGRRKNEQTKEKMRTKRTRHNKRNEKEALEYSPQSGFASARTQGRKEAPVLTKL